MNTPGETNLRRHVREMRESIAQLHAEQDADPHTAAKRKAMQPTKAETAELEAARAAVAEAEAAVGAAALTLRRAEEAKQRPPRGFAFFEKSRDAHRADVAAAAIPAARVDYEEARGQLAAAIRRRNEVARRVDRARLERRRAAKVKAGALTGPRAA